jgi:Zn-dependent protease with chaperone function
MWAPATLGVAAVLASLGVGFDHCLTHDPHHPHLCPTHASAAPGLVLLGSAAFIALRLALAAFGVIAAATQSHRAATALIAASEVRGGVHVFASAEPVAFVVGFFRPRVFASQRLFDLGPDVVEPVLAHEEAHAARGDVRQRAMAQLASFAHWPRVASALRRRLVVAQEVAADADAALVVGDPLRVAEALLRLTRLAPSPRVVGMSFTDGDVSARVLALVAAQPNARAPRRVVAVFISASVVALLCGGHHVHHALETLLGALN